MFLCLKYLPLEQIGPWLTSAFSIKDRYWRAQIIAFFVAAEDLLTGKVTQPSEMAKAQPSVAWEYSYVLTGIYYGAFAKPPLPFLPEARRKAALDAIAGYFDVDIYFEWLCAIEEDAELEAELMGTTDVFLDLYLRSTQ
jgi:hypothetical protein